MSQINRLPASHQDPQGTIATGSDGTKIIARRHADGVNLIVLGRGIETIRLSHEDARDLAAHFGE
jgi:hypothetical protein